MKQTSHDLEDGKNAQAVGDISDVYSVGDISDDQAAPGQYTR